MEICSLSEECLARANRESDVGAIPLFLVHHQPRPGYPLAELTALKGTGVSLDEWQLGAGERSVTAAENCHPAKYEWKDPHRVSGSDYAERHRSQSA
jgi:hypothetical protein